MIDPHFAIAIVALLCMAVGAIFYTLGYWLRGKKFTYYGGWQSRDKNPLTAQWALLASLSSSQRTIARLKMQLTRAEEANHDLRERLEAAERNLSPRN